MTKIILLFWVLTPGDVSEVQTIEGWLSMEACEVAAESLTEPNPNEKEQRYAVITRCQVVPK